MNKKLKILIPLFVIILIAVIVIVYMKRNEAEKQPVNEDLIKNETTFEEKGTMDNVKENSIILFDTLKKTEGIRKEKQIKHSKWISYTNNDIGITFKCPPYFKKNGDDIKAVDLKGEVNSIEVHFIDTVNNDNLMIKYHPNPNGTELYNYKLTQYNKSEGIYNNEKKEILIAGNKAIVGISIRKIDGRGRKIIPPSKLTEIDMLCDELSGKLEIQFRTKADDKKSSETFNKILKTFKMLNN